MSRLSVLARRVELLERSRSASAGAVPVDSATGLRIAFAIVHRCCGDQPWAAGLPAASALLEGAPEGPNVWAFNRRVLVGLDPRDPGAFFAGLDVVAEVRAALKADRRRQAP
jgi:hypothetical protein